MRTRYCFDTHPLVWYFTGQKTLSQKARNALDQIFAQKVLGYIPVIVILEIFHLALKIKKFIFPEFLKQIRKPNVFIVSLDKPVLSQCFVLPKNLDIHDRVIAATAKINRCTLITKDRVLQQTKGLRTVW